MNAWESAPIVEQEPAWAKAPLVNDQVSSAKKGSSAGGYVNEIGRGLSRGAADLVSGAAGAPLDIANILAQPVGQGLGYVAEKAGFPQTAAQFRYQPETSYTDKIRGKINDLTSGYTEERSPAERIVGTAGRFVSGAASGGGLAGKINPKLAFPKTTTELAGSVTGGVGFGVGNEYAPDNPATQIGLALAAGSVPGLAKSVPGAAARLAGVDPQKVKTVTEAGLQPNLAVAGGNVPKRLQNVLNVVPGGSGVIEKSTKATLDAMEGQINNAIRAAGKPGSAEVAGVALQRGVTKAVEQFKQTSKRLYDEFGASVDPGQNFPIQNTLSYVENQGSGLTPAIKQAFENPKLKPIVSAIQKDASDGQLPFQTIQRIRSQIGGLLDDGSLITDIPRGELKQIYGALSKDLEFAARASGPEAFKKYQRASSYYRQGSAHIEKWFDKVSEARTTAEKAFKILENSDNVGGSVLRNVLRGLPAEEAGVVRSSILQRLGQDAARNGDFSPTRFLSNYKKLAPEAKSELLRGNAEYQRNLNKLSDAAELFGKVRQFENFSRSGEQAITGGLYGGAGTVFLSNLLSGNLGGAAATAATGAAAYSASKSLAKLMQSPRFVAWLARAAEKNTDVALANHIRGLTAVVQNDPQIANDVKAVLGQAKITK